jgi:hypothetical protein
MLSIT